MKRLLLAIPFAAFLILSSSAVLAGNKHGRGHDDDHHGHHDNGKHKGWKKDKNDFRRGERIDVVYLERRYYVDDYRSYHLHAPPRGHRWVRSDDGKFILVAVATGIIADILLHH